MAADWSLTSFASCGFPAHRCVGSSDEWFILRVNYLMQPWAIGTHRFRGFLPVFLGKGYRALDTVDKVQRIFEGWFHGQQRLPRFFPWFFTRTFPECLEKNAVSYSFFNDTL
jgi:hypothetical protein